MKLINLNNMTTINQQNPDLDGNRKTNTPHIMEKGCSIDKMQPMDPVKATGPQNFLFNDKQMKRKPLEQEFLSCFYIFSSPHLVSSECETTNSQIQRFFFNPTNFSVNERNCAAQFSEMSIKKEED